MVPRITNLLNQLKFQVDSSLGVLIVTEISYLWGRSNKGTNHPWDTTYTGPRYWSGNVAGSIRARDDKYATSPWDIKYFLLLWILSFSCVPVYIISSVDLNSNLSSLS